jgi:hypothetical protein
VREEAVCLCIPLANDDDGEDEEEGGQQPEEATWRWPLLGGAGRFRIIRDSYSRADGA